MPKVFVRIVSFLVVSSLTADPVAAATHKVRVGASILSCLPAGRTRMTQGVFESQALASIPREFRNQKSPRPAIEESRIEKQASSAARGSDQLPVDPPPADKQRALERLERLHDLAPYLEHAISFNVKGNLYLVQGEIGRKMGKHPDVERFAAAIQRLRMSVDDLQNWAGEVDRSLHAANAGPAHWSSQHRMLELAAEADDVSKMVAGEVQTLLKWFEWNSTYPDKPDLRAKILRYLREIQLLLSEGPVIVNTTDLADWLREFPLEAKIQGSTAQGGPLQFDGRALLGLLLPIIRNGHEANPGKEGLRPQVLIQVGWNTAVQRPFIRVENDGILMEEAEQAAVEDVLAGRRLTLFSKRPAHGRPRGLGLRVVRREAAVLGVEVHPEPAQLFPKGTAWVITWPSSGRPNVVRPRPPVSQAMVDQYLVDVGFGLQRLRKGKGWSLKELAHRAEVSYDSLKGLETGQSATRTKIMIRVAQALKSAMEIITDPGAASSDEVPAFDRALTGPELADRLEGFAQAAEISFARWAEPIGKTRIFVRNGLRSLRADKSVELDTLFLLVKGLGLTMRELWSIRAPWPYPPPSQEYYALRPEKAKFVHLSQGELPDDEEAERWRKNLAKLNAYDPEIRAVVERVLNTRSGNINQVLTDMAQETKPGKNANQLHKQWLHGIAVLRNPVILDWLEDSKELPQRIEERMEDLGLDLLALSNMTGIPSGRLLTTVDPKLDWLQKVAKALQTNVTWLVLGEEPLEPADPVGGTFAERFTSLFEGATPTDERKAFGSYFRDDLSRYKTGSVPRMRRLLWMVWASPRPRPDTFGYLAAGEKLPLEPDEQPEVHPSKPLLPESA
jgi:transcriptional regulator with XRE-family HTH domain